VLRPLNSRRRRSATKTVCLTTSWREPWDARTVVQSSLYATSRVEPLSIFVLRDHLTDDEITAYSNGSVPTEVKQRMEQHAASCNRYLHALMEGLRERVRPIANEND
jgi:hypothetical protein